MEAEHAARINAEKQRDDLHLDLERAERDLRCSQESIMDLKNEMKK